MNAHEPGEFETLLQRWLQTVQEVERGYALTFDDYLNDLDVRHSIRLRLHESGNAGNSRTFATLRNALADADQRFRAATVSVGECVWGEANAREEGWTAEGEWYYYRVPITWREAW